MKGLFVTGTDTDVGKTIITSGIAAVLKEKQVDIGVYKPLLSGVSREHTKSDTSLLKEGSQTPLTHKEITPFEFKEPLAPYVAGKLEGRSIYLKDVVNHWNQIKHKHHCFLVEGAGGISVPLGPGFLVSDLITALDLPTIIVTRPNLGTINHTFLTVKYAQSLGIMVAGIIINGKNSDVDLAEQTNPEVIEKQCKVPILGITPRLEDVNIEAVKQMIKEHLDVSSIINILEGTK
ncbi:dethiobiotin synthase [Metabacillus halosaccharovorans]|uniref:ATP-dependent dethiobiotin synthetase BioD n=1 Tax=Metabacillus halosaccharovorans TaxID=930124 RepID=A0ABT3DAQ9_9BACI|nr:dethiobiotin synthase [Metabacillus halosaccharovorans]MCV9884144.1 dethiobiotin synthase [Metabacillus halosaccharovorans]